MDRMRTYLQGVIKVAHLAETVEELVNPCLIVLDEWVQRDHVCFFCVRRLIREVLQHLCYL